MLLHEVGAVTFLFIYLGLGCSVGGGAANNGQLHHFFSMSDASSFKFVCLFFFFFFRLGAIIFVGETMSRKGFSLSFAWLIKRDRLVYVMASLPPSGVNYARLTAAR